MGRNIIKKSKFTRDSFIDFLDIISLALIISLFPIYARICRSATINHRRMRASEIISSPSNDVPFASREIEKRIARPIAVT